MFMMMTFCVTELCVVIKIFTLCFSVFVGENDPNTV